MVTGGKQRGQTVCKSWDEPVERGTPLRVASEVCQHHGGHGADAIGRLHDLYCQNFREALLATVQRVNASVNVGVE